MNAKGLWVNEREDRENECVRNLFNGLVMVKQKKKKKKRRLKHRRGNQIEHNGWRTGRQFHATSTAISISIASQGLSGCRVVILCGWPDQIGLRIFHSYKAICIIYVYIYIHCILYIYIYIFLCHTSLNVNVMYPYIE